MDNLSDEELLPIAAKYPVIKKMCEMKAYSSLLRIPFYIELILEKDINPDDIHDEVALREYIWDYIICQKEKAKNQINIKSHITYQRMQFYILIYLI